MLLRKVTHAVPPHIVSVSRATPFSRLIATRRHSSHDSTTSQDVPDFTEVLHPPGPQKHQSPTKLLTELSKRLPSFHEALAGPSDSQAAVFNRTIQELRSVLLSKNIEKAWVLWSRLNSNSLLGFLGPEHHDTFSRLVSGACTNWSKNTTWTDVQEKSLEEMALSCATAGSTEGLKDYMVVWIKRNDPTTVLRLYDRYMTLKKDKPEWFDSQRSGQDGTSMDNKTASSSVHTDVLLAVVTAHAMRDAFFDALHMSLQTTTRFPTHSIGSFAEDLKHDPALQKKVKDYVRRLETARLVARPPALAKQLSNLSRDHAITNLEKLYNAIMEGFTEPLIWITVKPEEMKSSDRVLLPEQTWASFVLAFQWCRRADLVERVWKDMAAVGVRPNVAAWTALIDGYGEQKNAEGAINSWDSMLKEGVKPDLTTHRAIISALFAGNRPEGALLRFRTLRKEIGKSKGASDDPLILVVYNTALHGLFQHHKETEATAIFDEMRTEGPKPDVVTFNTVLHYYGRKGNLKAFANILQQLDVAGVTGDAFTFSTVLHVLIKFRDDAPQIMLNLMAKQGVKPTAATLSTIIDRQMRSESDAGVKAALSLLEKMENSEGDARPNEVTYTAILSGLHRATWLDRQVADDHCKAILERMHKRGIKLSKTAYNILLKACLNGNSSDGVQSAMQYYREMRTRKMFISNDTWYILLHGLAQRREWGLANEVAQHLVKGDYKPSGVSCALCKLALKRLNLGRIASQILV